MDKKKETTIIPHKIILLLLILGLAVTGCDALTGSDTSILQASGVVEAVEVAV